MYSLPKNVYDLTVEGAREEELCIGDILRVGGALVQVSLPRDPCKTLDRLNGIDGPVDEFNQTVLLQAPAGTTGADVLAVLQALWGDLQ